MWNVSLPPWEFVVRASIVYVALLLLLRFTGKRQVGQLSPFDLVLLLIISNGVQNAMNGGDSSVTGGLILAGTLVGLNWLVSAAMLRSKKAEAFLEGRPIVLVHHGHVDPKALRQAQMTIHELHAALRAEGMIGPDEVLIAFLENNGKVTVVPKHKPSPA